MRDCKKGDREGNQGTAPVPQTRTIYFPRMGLDTPGGLVGKKRKAVGLHTEWLMLCL